MAVLRLSEGEVFVIEGTLGATRRVKYLFLLALLAGFSLAQDQTPPPQSPPPTTNQKSDSAAPDQSGNQDQNDSGQQNSDKNPGQPDSDKDDKLKANPNVPEHQGMMGTVNSTVNATVDQVRRLPAQWFLGSYVPANQNLHPLTLEERRDVYIRQTYLTGASYLKRLFAAGIDQARGVPYEWGGGMGGYGQRFASRYGQFIIQNSLAAAGNAVLGYEPRYDYCKCIGFWPRTKHAISRNFITYNRTEVEKRWQIPLYVGAFAGGVIAGETWRPENESALKNGAYAVAGQAGYGILSNWLQEFALDIGRKISPKRRSRGSSLTEPTETPSKLGADPAD